MRPASAAMGDAGDDGDPSWHIGEMRPRGYSAPSPKHCGRISNNGNNGGLLPVTEVPLSHRHSHASHHTIRKV